MRLWAILWFVVLAGVGACGQSEKLAGWDGKGEKDAWGWGEKDSWRLDGTARRGEETPNLLDWFQVPDDNRIGPGTKDGVIDWLPWNDGQEKELEKPDEGLKVKDLQSSPESLNCMVEFATQLIKKDVVLAKVVVTAPVYAGYLVEPEQMDGFYVADAEGGVFSGIQVACKPEVIPELVPGMTLTLVGDYKEAQCYSVLFASSILIEAEAGPEVEPVDTSPELIESDPEQFEGVLVKVTEVTVTDDNPDKAEGWDKQEFIVNGVLRVGNDYKLPYMNPETDERTVGDVFQHIIGVVRYKDGEFCLMPRFPSDMVKEGEPTPDEEPENIEQPEMAEEPQEAVEEAEGIEDVFVPEPEVVEQPEEVVEDTEGNVPDEVNEAELVIPDKPGSPVVITEIMYDPVGMPDEKGEWFEIFNAGDEPVDLNGWRLTDESGVQHIIQFGMPLIIEPDEYFVMGSNADESTNGGVKIGYQYPYCDFKLENDKPDSIILRNMFGELVDSVHFGTKLGFPAAKGASLVLIHPNLDNEDPANWTVATTPYGDGSNKGTPWGE